MRRDPVVIFGDGSLAIEDVARLAARAASASLSASPAFLSRIARSREALDAALARGDVVYGVNTGYGDSCDVPVPDDLVDELPHRLVAYHGVGLGRFFDAAETRAILAARTASLARGCSGVRLELLEALVGLLREDVLPVMPSEGSVGASGDLTPLSYVAAVLMGEREAWRNGAMQAAGDALREARLAPLRLQPKEALALMNGTSAMTGLACLAWSRAQALCRIAARITAGNVLVLHGNPQHYDAALMAMKPHRGPQRVAAWIREDMGAAAANAHVARVQDRYSLRCAPHVVGVLEDALQWTRRHVEDELNSVNDNPVIDPASGRILHGGHFYGGHIAFAMDGLKAAVANVADLLDRQLALLVDPRYNAGLPANLAGRRDGASHGLKALQISVSAWTAEALKLTMPASVFSRSTECHNQDKVSLGTIAARDCLRVLDLSEQVAAAMLLALRQAIALRFPARPAVGPGLAGLLDTLEDTVAFVDQDRRLDLDLRAILSQVLGAPQAQASSSHFRAAG